MCNSVAMLTGNMYLTESAHKLPRELIIPSDRLHLLDSIGQGELGVYILHSHSTTSTTGPTQSLFFLCLKLFQRSTYALPSPHFSHLVAHA